MQIKKNNSQEFSNLLRIRKFERKDTLLSLTYKGASSETYIKKNEQV